MEKDWVKIFTANQAFKAEIVKGMLNENGVTAVLVNSLDSSFGALSGRADLYVHQSQAENAKTLIQTSVDEDDNDGPEDLDNEQ
jgi:hypothetical protein